MVAPRLGRLTRHCGILVVGAGPTGMALALQAHDHGADIRIIERRLDAFRPSRALIVHPRTLEVLRPLGVTDALLARADIEPRARLHLGNRAVGVRFGRLALADAAFPHLSLLRQMDVEQVLGQALADRGVVIERGTELIAVRQCPEGAHAVVRSPAGPEAVLCRYVVGCDGPASTVRSHAGIGWRGGPYPVEVLLADVELGGDLDPGVIHVVAGRDGLFFAFPLGEQATWRLLATRPAGGDSLPFGQPGPPVDIAELQALAYEAGLDARITELAWSARVRLQHRLASRFRRGRLFLAGDAAHSYSPATGQGMNTGIQDALNLGWKLAFAGRASPDASLLDSYERERRPVARHTLLLTHSAFWAEASVSGIAARLRGDCLPMAAPVIPLLLNRRRLTAAGIRFVSQLRVAYSRSPLTVAGTPPLHGWGQAGHRLPDQTVCCDGRRVRLHELVAHPGVHVLVSRDAGPVETMPLGPFVSVHRIDSAPGRGLIAVRPDGYVGFSCRVTDVSQLLAWLARAGAGPAADR